MRLLLSGEGPTDMGSMQDGREGREFVPGPMAWLVDRAMQPRVGFSPLELRETDPDAVGFVSKNELADDARALRPGKPKALPGAKNEKGTGFFRRNAEMLGARALRDADSTGRFVVAVLFRDSDGTRSSPRDEWQRKRKSMADGFELSGCSTGVPMLPRPKSEAWLLCALKEPPYQHCARLEDTSGNDGSPNSLKRQLAALIGREPGAEEQSDWVRDGRVDPDRLNLPSFQAFTLRLNAVLDQLR